MTHETKIRFDAHCHLFNLDYLFLESANMLFDVLNGHYPLVQKLDNSQGASTPHDSTKRSILDFLKWLKELEGAFVGGEEEHLDALLSKGRKHWRDGSSLAAVAHMMDIYYLFAPELPAGKAPVELGHRPEPWWERGLERLEQALDQTQAQWRKLELVDHLVDFLRQKMSPSLDHSQDTTFHQTYGYSHHRKELEALKRRRPREVYPFFAVDPRRPGAVNAVVSGDVVGKGKLFQGVKLYPRLGYHPQCEALQPLFAYCADHGVPIVTHAAPHGFPLTGGNADFGHPRHFLPILERHPNLVIDFAHFGFYNDEWAEWIATLIGQFPNVYSDLACYTDDHELSKFRQTFWNRPKVRERTMFGTDFDVFYMVSVGKNLDNYYDAFGENGRFNGDELFAMSSTVPKQFLSTVVDWD